MIEKSDNDIKNFISYTVWAYIQGVKKLWFKTVKLKQ